MLRRIYCLVPSVEVARKVVDEVLLARVEEKHIHVLAKRGTPLEDLPEATMMQKSDFIPAIERGVAQGGVVGLLAGLVGIALTPGAMVIAGGIILACSLTGAGVGAWIGGMIGLNIGNTRLKRFPPFRKRRIRANRSLCRHAGGAGASHVTVQVRSARGCRC